MCTPRYTQEHPEVYPGDTQRDTRRDTRRDTTGGYIALYYPGYCTVVIYRAIPLSLGYTSVPGYTDRLDCTVAPRCCCPGNTSWAQFLRYSLGRTVLAGLSVSFLLISDSQISVGFPSQL